MLKDAPRQNGHAAAESPAPARRVARTVRPARVTRRLARAPGRAGDRAAAACGCRRQGDACSASGLDAPSADVGRRRSATSRSRVSRRASRARTDWDAQKPDQHQRQVAPFRRGTGRHGGLQAPPRGQQQVLWTTAIQDQRDAHGDRSDHGGRADHTPAALPRRPGTPDGAGILVVPRYPALVGPPVSDPGAAPAEERDVTDGGLRAVAQRP